MMYSTDSLPPNTGLENGRYRVIDTSGRGPWGHVYRAADQDSDGTWRSDVAIKELLVACFSSDIEAKAAYDRETSALSGLTRDNQRNSGVPQYRASFSDPAYPGRYFIVQEFIEGQTLAQMLHERDGNSLPWQQVMSFGIRLCEILVKQHQRGRIHRDVKPSNVMVEKGTNRLVLIDYGTTGRAFPSPNRTIVATPGYSSPQQLRGDGVDVRDDIYAVGATLHALLSGSRRLPDVRYKECQDNGQPSDLIMKRLYPTIPNIPPSLNTVIANATQFDQRRRYPSMEALAQALRQASSSQHHARPLILQRRYLVPLVVGVVLGYLLYNMSQSAQTAAPLAASSTPILQEHVTVYNARTHAWSQGATLALGDVVFISFNIHNPTPHEAAHIAMGVRGFASYQVGGTTTYQAMGQAAITIFGVASSSTPGTRYVAGPPVSIHLPLGAALRFRPGTLALRWGAQNDPKSHYDYPIDDSPALRSASDRALFRGSIDMSSLVGNQSLPARQSNPYRCNATLGFMAQVVHV